MLTIDKCPTCNPCLIGGLIQSTDPELEQAQAWTDRSFQGRKWLSVIQLPGSLRYCEDNDMWP